MAKQLERNKNRTVENAGKHTASLPTANSDCYIMPSIMQPYVIEPTFVNQPTQAPVAQPVQNSEAKDSTLDDYQPKKEDMAKKWKRKKRALNSIGGIIALVASLVVLMPYVFGFFGTEASLPIVVSFDTFNSIRALWDGVPKVISLGIFTPESNGILVTLVPHAILAIGILAVAINVIKSIFALLFVKKPVKYTKCAIVNLLCVLAVFIASLVGAPLIGINKIDFMADVINGYASSEYFTLLAFAIGYLLVSAICTLINRDKYGYLK